MDEHDIANVGVAALAGAATAFGPAGGTVALLGLTLSGVLGLYGGSAAAPPPSLTAGEVDQIVKGNLLRQDVRDAWALMSPAHDWYREWTVRAKSGEQFTAADLADFDHGYQQVMGPNSNLRSGLAKLYAGNATLDSCPGQYGVPILILGVGLFVQLLQLDIARTAERAETVSAGQWQNLAGYLTFWEGGVQACDHLAAFRVEEAARTMREKDPTRLSLGSAALAAVIASFEIQYRGGSSEAGQMPAITAIGKIEDTLGSMRAKGYV